MEIIKECQCGKVLKATSESQMKYNYDLHLNSTKHKRYTKEGDFKTCERCGKEPRYFIHVHHKNLNHSDNRKQNLMYICEECHNFIHSKKNKNKEGLDLIKHEREEKKDGIKTSDN